MLPNIKGKDMKLQQIIFAILIFGLIGCHTNKKVVLINGKIIGESKEQVQYTIPLNGICYWGFNESIQPDSLGNFQLVIRVYKPSFIKLSVPEKSYGTIVVEPGGSYNIEFDLSKKDKNFYVSGETESAQNLYNKLPNPGHIQVGARQYLKDTVSSIINVKISNQKAEEISKFKELLDKGKISKGFFNLVKNDRDLYYAAITGNVALHHFRIKLRKNENFPPELKQLWESVFLFLPLTNKSIMSSPWFYSYAENYVNFKEYTSAKFNLQNLIGLYENKTIHTHNIQESEKFLTGAILEYYYAVYVYFWCYQKKYEKEFISIFDKFKNDYPNSFYTKYLNTLVEPIVKFHEAKEIDFSENVRFVDNYQSIETLKQAVETLKGKKVYVDVWATWCYPCKKEFEYKSELKKLLKSNDIEILYISIDRDEDDSQWKDMIKYYNLEGNHIRASEELVADLKRIFNQSGRISIPWYILIDNNGEIIKEHAPRPSQIKELETELNEN